MTVETLETEIQSSRDVFAVSHCSTDAERTARLLQFKNLLLAKRYSTGTHDWIGPEDFARQQSPTTP